MTVLQFSDIAKLVSEKTFHASQNQPTSPFLIVGDPQDKPKKLVRQTIESLAKEKGLSLKEVDAKNASSVADKQSLVLVNLELEFLKFKEARVLAQRFGQETKVSDSIQLGFYLEQQLESLLKNSQNNGLTVVMIQDLNDLKLPSAKAMVRTLSAYQNKAQPLVIMGLAYAKPGEALFEGLSYLQEYLNHPSFHAAPSDPFKSLPRDAYPDLSSPIEKRLQNRRSEQEASPIQPSVEKPKV